MKRKEILLREVPRGGQFYMVEKGRKIYISFGKGKESFLDMSGPSTMPYIDYAPLKFLTSVKREYTMYTSVWIDV